MKNNLKFFITGIIILFNSTLYSQDPIIVSINSNSSSSVSADRINFMINLTVEHDEYQPAFETHKEKLKELTDILNHFSFPDSAIKFSLFRIAKRKLRGSDYIYRTDQTVNLDITSINKYEELQLALIAKGFDSFSAKFFSSNSNIGIERATQKAIRIANQMIRSIAKELGKENYTILEIEVGPNSRRTSGDVFEFFTLNSRDTIEEIPQLIEFVVEVNIKYQLN